MWTAASGGRPRRVAARVVSHRRHTDAGGRVRDGRIRAVVARPLVGCVGIRVEVVVGVGVVVGSGVGFECGDANRVRVDGNVTSAAVVDVLIGQTLVIGAGARLGR